MIDSRELDEPRANVVWLYTNVLGREPEGEAFIDGWVVKNLPFIELARNFVKCDEFQRIHPEGQESALRKLRWRLKLAPGCEIFPREG